MSSRYIDQIEWKTSVGLVEYQAALDFMEARVQAMIDGAAHPCVWFLEHPPLYTAGTSADAADMIDAHKLPIFEAGRGGEYTYHGPGQLVAYCMLDLKQLFAPNAPDLRAYIKILEQWIIATLAEFGVQGLVREGRVGVWVPVKSETRTQKPENTIPTSDFRLPTSDFSEAKIAAIGVRVRKWVAFHGISINVQPDLSHYSGIVPCGIKEYGVTSFDALGVRSTVKDVAQVMQGKLAQITI